MAPRLQAAAPYLIHFRSTWPQILSLRTWLQSRQFPVAPLMLIIYNQLCLTPEHAATSPPFAVNEPGMMTAMQAA
jgi:hypothetical protein